MKRGEFLESEFSNYLWEKGTPVLVCPRFLRERGCGQVDGMMFRHDTQSIVCFEVKSSGNVSKTQLDRLKGSVSLLGHLFSVPISLNLAFVKNRKLPIEWSFLKLY